LPGDAKFIGQALLRPAPLLPAFVKRVLHPQPRFFAMR
jgi:hypothetical protein